MRFEKSFIHNMSNNMQQIQCDKCNVTTTMLQMQGNKCNQLNMESGLTWCATCSEIALCTRCAISTERTLSSKGRFTLIALKVHQYTKRTLDGQALQTSKKFRLAVKLKYSNRYICLFDLIFLVKKDFEDNHGFRSKKYFKIIHR